MMEFRFVIVLCVALASIAQAALPSYIQVCKRNDPQLTRCILRSVEALKPRLVKGIPELDIPALEPLNLDKLVVEHGNMLKVRGSDFVVHGASAFKINDFKVDMKNGVMQVKMSFPKLTIKAIYEVKGNFLNLNLHGKGPVSVDAEDVDGNAILKMKMMDQDGDKYMIADSLDLKLNLKNYEVKLGQGFFKDKAITDAVNIAIHENKRDVINLVRPRVESTVKGVLLEIADKITRHFTYDELFPK